VSGFQPWAPPSAIRGAARGEDAGVAACKQVSSAMGASSAIRGVAGGADAEADERGVGVAEAL